MAASRRVQDPEAVERSVRPLPVVLKAWSRIGRMASIKTRLRISRRLCAALVTPGQAYHGGGGFTFAIDPDDYFQATMLLGLHDPVVEGIVDRFAAPGSIAIDAGANLGYFSLRLGRRVGPTGAVHAFECDPRVAPRLRRHTELNRMSWVTVNEAGVMDRDEDEFELYLPDQLGWASMIENAWGAERSVSVRMVALDSYAQAAGIDPERVSFLKLDVEGAELQALQGAGQLLAASNAAVLVELIPGRMRALGQDPADLLGWMDDLGFEPWSPVGSERGRLRLQRGSEPGIGEDVLFIKRSRSGT